ncbi:MAG TPA: hypothetical protein PKD52_07825 [Clostridiales bacterium]|nr:hypothetical protein [Clostridiales bacterium]
MKDHYFQEQKYTLRLPAILLLYPLFDTLLGIILLSMMIANQNMPGIIVVGILFIIPMLLALGLYAFYRVTFDAEGFAFRSARGKTYDYAYEDIIEIIPGTRFGKIIVEGRSIYVNTKNNQYRYFQEYADKKRGIKTQRDMNEYIVLRDGLFPLLLGLAFLFPSISIMIGVDDFTTRVVFSIFALCGGFFCIYWKNSSIRYNKEVLICRNPLGKEKTYQFADLTGVTMVSGGEILIFDNKKLSLDMYLKGIDELMDYVNQLSEEHDIDLDKRRKDLFNGNLLYPEQTKVTAIALIFYMIFLGVTIQFDPMDTSACETQTVIFSRVYNDEDIFTQFSFSQLELYSDGNDIPYLMNAFKEYGNKQNEFFQKLYHGEAFQITGYYTEDKSYFVIVECLGHDGAVYLSLENAKLADKDGDTRFAYVLYCIAGLIFVLFTGFVILIRNLHKFPEPIINFILKFVAPSSNFFTKLYPVDTENEEKTGKRTA